MRSLRGGFWRYPEPFEISDLKSQIQSTINDARPALESWQSYHDFGRMQLNKGGSTLTPYNLPSEASKSLRLFASLASADVLRLNEPAAAFNCCGENAFDREQDESGQQKPSPKFLLRFQFG